MTNINSSSRNNPLNNLTPAQRTNQKPSSSEPVPQEQPSSTSGTPDDNVNHQNIGSADTSPNQVEFGAKTDGQQTKDEEIQELNALMTEGKDELEGFLKDPKNDEMETLGFIMEHAEQTLSEKDFAKLNDRLFPKPPTIPEDATPKEKQELMKDYDSRVKDADKMKKELMKNVDVYRKSAQSNPAALDNLVNYLAKNTVNIAKCNPGC